MSAAASACGYPRKSSAKSATASATSSKRS
jgi:hypothetical protein